MALFLSVLMPTEPDSVSVEGSSDVPSALTV